MWQYLVGNETNFSRGFMLAEKASAERRKFIRQYFASLVKAQGKNRLAFKITGPPRMGYLLSIFPDAVFVLIRRKPIPTISSLLKVDFWQSRDRTRLWWTGPYSREEKKWVENNKEKPELVTAFQLIKIYWAEQHEISEYQPSVLKVNYEDFTSNPNAEIDRMLEFCGLTFDAKISDYLRSNPISQRNLPDERYFDKKLLKQINDLLDERIVC